MKRGFHYIDPSKKQTTDERKKFFLVVLILIVLFLLGFLRLKSQQNRKPLVFELITEVNAQVLEQKHIKPVVIEEPGQETPIQVIQKIWGSDWQVGVAIAKCESSLQADAFNPHNANGSWDAGLFQINSVHGISKEDLMIPKVNAKYAYSLYLKKGVQPWYSSNRCHGLLSR